MPIYPPNLFSSIWWCIEHQWWHRESGGERWRDGECRIQKSRKRKEWGHGWWKKDMSASLMKEECDKWKGVVLRGGAHRDKALLVVYSLPNGWGAAFGSATNRACLSAGVAGYHYGSFSGSGWTNPAYLMTFMWRKCSNLEVTFFLQVHLMNVF